MSGNHASSAATENPDAVWAKVERYQPGVPVVALTTESDWDAYLRTMYAGAFDCLAMPPAPLEAQRVLWSAIHAFTSTHADEAVPT